MLISKGVKNLVAAKHLTSESFNLLVKDGATFSELVEAALAYLKGRPFDVVYIAGGACDITTKIKLTGEIVYNWGSGPELEEHLVRAAKEADRSFRRDFPASKIVMCPLIAIELARVVGPTPTCDINQRSVEDAIWAFNTAIFEINNERGVFAPALHHQVHRFCKGKRRAYYHHPEDGLHPTHQLKAKWADEFIKAMAQN